MTTEAELFAIRCGINQAMQIINVHHIIITTDSIHATKRIFNLSIYLYQIQSTIISRELRGYSIEIKATLLNFEIVQVKKIGLLIT